MTISRRSFNFGLGSLAFAGLAARATGGTSARAISEVHGYGPLQVDPNGLVDLPKGFSYRVISRFGNLMDDGFLVPSAGDGMGAFAARNGKVALVRNHELNVRDGRFGPFTAKVADDFATYDRGKDGMPLPGGTTTLIYDPKTQQVEKQWLSLVGTIRNCAGGVTPWGSWLSCEENTTRAGDTAAKDHGYIFEVPASHVGLVAPVPLVAMGRFMHEAACIDPRTGIVYMTEDRDDSLLYRFLPDAKGELAKGGRLEALAVDGLGDSRNWNGQALERSKALTGKWVQLDDPEAPEDDLRKRGAAKGATLFARGEGIWWGNDELYFTCTDGGAIKYGQIFRLRPDVNGTADILDLFYESTDKAAYNYGDNLCVMPTGHLMVCEDQYTDITDNHLRGITPGGKAYAFARSRVQTEFAGACFSPDGSTLFVNLMWPTMTLAISGPWGQVRTN
jgi:uncharacterized protein